MITGTTTQIANSFIVYAVKLTNFPETLYVGCCPLEQFSQLADVRSNSEWQRLVTPDTPIIVTPLLITADRETAAAAQETLKGNAWCNRAGIALRTPTQRVRCITNDTIYDTASEAARAHNVSRSAMSHHLNGRMAAIQGLRFERVYD